MRILIATGLYPPEIGGPATYAKLFEEWLPRYGIKVSVLPFRTVRHLPPIIRHIVYGWKVFKMARGADRILVQDSVSTGLPVAIASFFSGKQFIIRVPGDYAWEQGTQRFGVKESIDDFQTRSYGLTVAILRAIQKFVVRRARLVIAPSQYLARIVGGWVPNKKIDVIYNGVDVPTRTLSRARELDLIVTSGRLVPWKGFGELIEIVGRKPEWRLVILGDGPQKNELKEQIQQTGTADRITLLGQVSHEEALAWYARATVFVLNSRYEGLSHTLVEAMATGAPIIATKAGGNVEVVTGGGIGGILVDVDDKKNLEQQLEYLMQNENLRTQLGDVAWSRANSFSIEACVLKTVELIKQSV